MAKNQIMGYFPSTHAPPPKYSNASGTSVEITDRVFTISNTSVSPSRPHFASAGILAVLNENEVGHIYVVYVNSYRYLLDQPSLELHYRTISALLVDTRRESYFLRV
jgi:hypothetical protein